MKKVKFSILGMLVMALAFGVMACNPDGSDIDVLAGTVWNGRRETPATFSYTIVNNKFTWDYETYAAIVLTKEGVPYSSGGSLAGTVWYNESEDFRLEFIDATNVKSSWGPLDYITYTLVGDTINFDYTLVREGTLAFKENSTFQFNDSNTIANGTYKTDGGSITLNGKWETGDVVGTDWEVFVVSGTVSGGTITLARGDFWGIMIFNKAAEPWYPKKP
jgi:hypothetical protein